MGKELDELLHQRYRTKSGVADFHDALVQAARGAAGQDYPDER
jgi:hypothetical protein